MKIHLYRIDPILHSTPVPLYIIKWLRWNSITDLYKGSVIKYTPILNMSNQVKSCMAMWIFSQVDFSSIWFRKNFLQVYPSIIELIFDKFIVVKGALFSINGFYNLFEEDMKIYNRYKHRLWRENWHINGPLKHPEITHISQYNCCQDAQCI